jgi:hypothetical protein
MKSLKLQSKPTGYVGHVKNGVIVLDSHASLKEGQAVRIEPIHLSTPTLSADERTEQIQRMKALFAQWNEEDRLLSDEDAELLQNALNQNRRLSIHSVDHQ